MTVGTLKENLLVRQLCMTLQQPGLTVLAKQSDLTAIAALMNRSLQPKGIAVKVAYQKGHLRVLLEGQTVPDQTILAPYVRKGIVALQIPGLHTLSVWGRSHGSSTPAWSETFALTAAELNPTLKPNLEPVKSDEPTRDASKSHVEDHLSGNQEFNANMKPDVASVVSLEAIAAHLNQAMGTETLVFEVALGDRILKLTAKTNQVLEGDTFAKAVQTLLLPLNLTDIATVQLYKQKTKSNTSYKIKEFTLLREPEPAPTEAAATDTKPLQPDLVANLSQPTRSQPQPTAPNAQVSRSASKSRWVAIALIALFVVLLIGVIKLLAKPPAAAEVCQDAVGAPGYCQLAVQMIGEQTLHDLKAAAAPITPAIEAKGMSLCERATDLQLQRRPVRQTPRARRSIKPEPVFPGIVVVDTQMKPTPQAGVTVKAAPQPDVTTFRTACLLAGNGDRLELIKTVVLPNAWPQDPYQGKSEWELMQRSLKVYQMFILLGGGTLFTAIGLFAASSLNLGFQIYSFRGLFQTASILGTLDTLLIILSGAKLNLFGGLPLTCLALGLTQMWVKDLRVDWAAGYRTVALGVFMMMILRTILNWLLLGFIFSVL